MITKEQHEDSEAIREDKEKFINFVNEHSQIGYNDTMDFMPLHYENLKPFQYNLMILKAFLK